MLPINNITNKHMKTIACSATVPQGGCDKAVTAATADEAKQMLGAHAQEAHTDMVTSATDEDKTNWGKNFDENVWPNTPDDK